MKLVFFSKQKGFSLVEIVVVVGILAILTTFIVVPNLKSVRSNSLDKSNLIIVDSLILSLEDYYQTCGQYPPLVEPSPAVTVNSGTGCPPGTTFEDLISVSERADYQLIRYVPIANLSEPEKCIGYHLGVELSSNSSYLEEDDDLDTDNSLPANFTYCNLFVETGEGLDGLDPVYDIVWPSSFRLYLN